MKIYRRLIPKISKDVVRVLLANRAIEVEEGHRDEAELDVAGAIVSYINDAEKLKTDAKDTLERRGLPLSDLLRVRDSLADMRKIVIGDGALDYLLGRVIEGLYGSKHVVEVFSDDDEIREFIKESIRKYLGVDEELDREVRSRLKSLREGTAEWEHEYSRLIDHMRYHSEQKA